MYLYNPHNRLRARITELLYKYPRTRTAILSWQGSSIDFIDLETIVGARGTGSVLRAFVGYRLTLDYLDGTSVQCRFEPNA